MAGLEDITPLNVDVAGVPVVGISGRSIGNLISQYPALKRLLAERTVDANMLIEQAPDAVASIIAAGIGKMGDKKQEKMADALPIGLQLQFLAAVLKVSFPNGLSAAVEAIKDIAKALPGAEDPDTTAPATN